jgi:osmotically-inducible protein OsmY
MLDLDSRRPPIALAAAVVLVAVLASPELAAQNNRSQRTAEALQRVLSGLTNYGVFDYIAFSLDRGTVTLVGYAYSSALRGDVERAAKRVEGVDEVANRVEVLPASLNDDRIRRATFVRIYTDGALSRYASGGEFAVWREAREFGRYPGLQPFGVYPIHIVVKHGRIALMGAVDSAADRQIAEFRAREITGVFEVSNELAVSGMSR